MFNLADLGISQGEAISALVAASGTAIVALVTKLMKTPDQIKNLVQENKLLNAKCRRLFIKARGYEQWITETSIRNNWPIPDYIRDNMRPDADQRDLGDTDGD